MWTSSLEAVGCSFSCRHASPTVIRTWAKFKEKFHLLQWQNPLPVGFWIHGKLFFQQCGSSGWVQNLTSLTFTSLPLFGTINHIAIFQLQRTWACLQYEIWTWEPNKSIKSNAVDKLLWTSAIKEWLKNLHKQRHSLFAKSNWPICPKLFQTLNER